MGYVHSYRIMQLSLCLGSRETVQFLSVKPENTYPKWSHTEV